VRLAPLSRIQIDLGKHPLTSEYTTGFGVEAMVDTSMGILHPFLGPQENVWEPVSYQETYQATYMLAECVGGLGATHRPRLGLL
jgi:hypothetical protein